MYARIKSTRTRVKRDMYGMPVTEEEKSDDEEVEEGEEESGTGALLYHQHLREY